MLAGGQGKQYWGYGAHGRGLAALNLRAAAGSGGPPAVSAGLLHASQCPKPHRRRRCRRKHRRLACRLCSCASSGLAVVTLRLKPVMTQLGVGQLDAEPKCAVRGDEVAIGRQSCGKQCMGGRDGGSAAERGRSARGWRHPWQNGPWALREHTGGGTGHARSVKFRIFPPWPNRRVRVETPPPRNKPRVGYRGQRQGTRGEWYVLQKGGELCVKPAGRRAGTGEGGSTKRSSTSWVPRWQPPAHREQLAAGADGVQACDRLNLSVSQRAVFIERRPRICTQGPAGRARQRQRQLWPRWRHAARPHMHARRASVPCWLRSPPLTHTPCGACTKRHSLMAPHSPQDWLYGMKPK